MLHIQHKGKLSLPALQKLLSPSKAGPTTAREASTLCTVYFLHQQEATEKQDCTMAASTNLWGRLCSPALGVREGRSWLLSWKDSPIRFVDKTTAQGL